MPALEEPNCHQFLSETPAWFRERFEPFERAQKRSSAPAPTQPVTDGELTYLPGVAQPSASSWSVVGIIVLSLAIGGGMFGVLLKKTGQSGGGLLVLAGLLFALGIVFIVIGRRASRPDPDHAVRMGIVLVPEALVVIRRDRFGVYPRPCIHAFTKHWYQVSGPNNQPRSVTVEAMYLAEGRYIQLSEGVDPALRRRLQAWLSDAPSADGHGDSP